MPGIWDPSGVLSASESVGTGRNLGTARGEIRIDTSQAEQAGVVVKRVGQEMGQAFKPASVGIAAFRRDLQTLRGELSGIGLLTGGLSAIGIRTASSLQAARIQLTSLAGGVQAATALMANLREAGNAAGIPFGDMLKSARLLLPTLKGNTDQLDTYLKLARRVATLNQQEGVTGAAFAINEAIASGGTDLVSLAERFQISRFALRDALQQTGGDFAAALDLVLNQMGVTEDMADEMGASFDASLRRATDAAGQLAATGFAPLLDDMAEMLNKSAEWLNNLQATNPELAEMAALFLSGTTAASGFLLVLGQILTSYDNLQKTGLGRGGLTIAAGGLGVIAGVESARAIGRATGNEELAQSDIGRVWDILKATLLVVATQLLEFGNGFQQMLNRMSSSVGDFIVSIGQFVIGLGDWLAQLIPNLEGKPNALQSMGQGIVEFGQTQQMSEDEIMRAYEEAGRWSESLVADLAKALFPEYFTPPSEEEAAGTAAGGEAVDPRAFTEDQIAAWRQFQNDLAEISATAQEDRLAEEESYEKRRTDLLTQQAKERDKILSALDALEKKTNASIDAIEAEARAREAAAPEELNKKLGDLQDEFNQEEIQRLEDFQREEQRARAQHYINLLVAAARLDARSVWEQQLRFSQQQSERREDFDVETEQRTEELQARMDQERAAAETELEEARLADQERIQDLRDRLEEERQASEVRLEELRIEQQTELEDLRQSHADKMAAIDAHEIEQTTDRTTAFDAEAASWDGYWGDRFTAQDAAQAAELEAFKAYLEQRAMLLTGQEKPSGYYGDYGEGEFALGGPVTYTGRAMVHGSSDKPEYMLDPDTTSTLSRMLGGGFTQPQLVNAVAGGGSSHNYQVNANIVLGDIGQHSLPDIQRAVRQGVIDVLEELSR